ncbi:MAG: hypothetical protein QM831_22490 [Kofleriaceae bacterium]
MKASQYGNLVVRKAPFNGVKVFSATMFQDREALGEMISEWMAQNRGCQVTEFLVTQSSDAAFHCLTIIVFYREVLKRH